jgi:hypothetical protein
VPVLKQLSVTRRNWAGWDLRSRPVVVVEEKGECGKLMFERASAKLMPRVNERVCTAITRPDEGMSYVLMIERMSSER